MSPSKIYLHFSHIEKTLKKAVQELVDFCKVFLKKITKKMIGSRFFREMIDFP